MSMDYNMTSRKGRGGGNIDPSRLHLRTELAQIRKAARVLRDPDAGATWRPAIDPVRTLTKHHYMHRYKDGEIDVNNAMVSLSGQWCEFPSKVQSNVSECSCAKGVWENANVKEKDRRVFLHNWSGQKSDGAEDSKGQGLFSRTRDDERSKDVVDGSNDSMNGGGNDSLSDVCLSERYPFGVFRCKDSNLATSISCVNKKKSKSSSYCNTGCRHYDEKLRMETIMSRYQRNAVVGRPCFGIGKDDIVSSGDSSDDSKYFRSKSWAHSPAKLLRSRKKKDDSISCSTPTLSKSSCNKCSTKPIRAAESWAATTGSINDADDEVDDQLDLPGHNGCGIPCYWSRRSTPKSRAWYRSCSSPSLSYTSRKKGNHIFCRSPSVQRRRRYRSNKRRLNSGVAGQSIVPLLGQGRSSIGSGESDEFSTNFEELDVEASSSLDGRRWSANCRSQGGLDVVAINREKHEQSSLENFRSMSHRYRPMFFGEVIGQSVVVESLSNAVSRGRIAAIFLFQGPHGTGKTSIARILAAALNCLSAGNLKPCGICRECVNFVSGKSMHLIEVDGSNGKGINNVKNLLKSFSVVHPSAVPQFKVLVIDECHLLPPRAWLTFVRLLETPLAKVVTILTTTDIQNVPRTILSRCQKHIFNKISSSDIVTRLAKIAAAENLDVELDALDLITMNADGSMRDAETMLDQLSLLGKRINIPLVNELVGVVSDEKLLDLLELAMSSNTTETVIQARELMDSGVDPMVVVSRMAALIVDIIAGTYPCADRKHSSFFVGRCLSNWELDRLKHALAHLSEAEKHLRASTEHSTWFTATLMQLGSVASSNQAHSGSSREQSSKATEEDHINMLREAIAQKQRLDAQSGPENSDAPEYATRSDNQNSTSKYDPAFLDSQDGCKVDGITLRCLNSTMLNEIWLQCIEKCHSKALRQLLRFHGRLVSISEAKGVFVAQVVFGDENAKTRAEGFLSSITTSLEIVLQHRVEVRIILSLDPRDQMQIDTGESMASIMALVDSNLNFNEPMEASTGGINESEAHQVELLECLAGNANAPILTEMEPAIPEKRIESVIHQQRLETAWVQSLSNPLKQERNQVLPQNGKCPSNVLQSRNSVDNLHSQHWEDELNHELKALKLNDRMASQNDRITRRIDHSSISPSIMHRSSLASNFNKDNKGYESGSGAPCCSGMFCWSNAKPHPRGVKVINFKC